MSITTVRTILNREKAVDDWWGVTMGNYINALNAISGNNNTPNGWDNRLIQRIWAHSTITDFWPNVRCYHYAVKWNKRCRQVE